MTPAPRIRAMFLVRAVLVAAALAVAQAAAAPPKTLSYQGFLTNATDAPVDAPVQMTFKVYAVPTGGIALWSETQPSVTVAKGEFSTVLGNVTPLTLAFDVPYYLGVTVGADPEMTPRQPLAASAYAFRALTLDSGATLPGAVLTGSIPTATLPGTQITGSISTATIPGSHVTGDLSGVGNIDLASSTAATGNLVKNGTVFLHDFGSGNVFLGEPSGNFTMTGNDNTGVGDSTLTANTTGQFNTAVGMQALLHNTTGSGNTAIGEAALTANTTGANNTAVGDGALASTTTGNGLTAFGQSALFSNTSGAFNVAMGQGALLGNTVGSSNAAFGSGTLLFNTTAGKNTAIGTGALSNQAFGNAGVAWDSLNTAVGYNALANNQPTTTASGVNNTAVGALALSGNTIGFGNTAVGESALPANTTGQSNTAVGVQALQHNTTGQHNIAIGNNALFLNAGGSFNLAIGESTMVQSVTGFDNTAIGLGALNVATGSGNIALGENAGSVVTAGNNNIEIGNAGTATDVGVIRIGTAGTQTTAFMAGVRGVTTAGAAIAVLVDGNGQLGTVSSSRTVKEEIEDMGDTSAVLAKLRPVAFRYKERPGWSRQYGLIAEEVADVAPELAARSQDGMVETVYYQFLAPMLLNEYQKQLRINAEQRSRIDAQHARVEALERRLSILESKLGGTQ